MAVIRKGKGRTGRELEVLRPSSLLGPFEEMERWFEDFFPLRLRHRARAGWPAWAEMSPRLPRIDVIEREDEIVLRAELPGVDKDDLEVSVTDSNVLIKGSSRFEHEEEKGEYYCCEMAAGEFARSIALPETVDSDKVEASFKDGVLELKAPKVETGKRHRIEIS